jgi:uncharacterized protein (UPF0548 family)
MFFFRRPSSQTVDRFREVAEKDSLSYTEVGGTVNGSLPSSYNVDHNRVRLGYGADVFHRARVALGEWKMFELGWVELMHPSAPIESGQTVLILARTWGLYSLSASRVLKIIDDDDGAIRRWGFSYGTLMHHVERGEERFAVEHRRDDGSVWYDLLAYSVPHHPLAKLGYPISRAAQRRFAKDSKLAMLRAVS